MMSPEIRRFVDRVKLGFVATVSPEGRPNVSPKGTLLSLDKATLCFANIASPNTVRNLSAQPLAEVNVVDFLLRRGYRFLARGAVVESGDRFALAIDRFRAIGAGPETYPYTQIVQLEVLEVADLWSPAYDIGRTQEDLEAYYRVYYALDE